MSKPIHTLTNRVQVAPVCDTSAYAADDLIGGKITLEHMTSRNGLGGVIQSLTILDRAAQKSALTLVLFYQDPTGTTFTDQAAFDIDDADAPYAFIIEVAAADYVDFADLSIATITPQVAFTNYNGTMYLAIMSEGTPTYVAATDLQITFEVI